MACAQSSMTCKSVPPRDVEHRIHLAAAAAHVHDQNRLGARGDFALRCAGINIEGAATTIHQSRRRAGVDDGVNGGTKGHDAERSLRRPARFLTPAARDGSRRCRCSPRLRKALLCSARRPARIAPRARPSRSSCCARHSTTEAISASPICRRAENQATFVRRRTADSSRNCG